MNKYKITIISWAFLFLVIFVSTISIQAKAPKEYNGAFRVGEQLHYTIHWTYFKAGYSYMRVVGLKKYKGETCTVLESGARSIGFLGTLFTVKDKIISYWDHKNLRTLYSKKNLQEGNYFRRSIVYFNPIQRTAKWSLEIFSGNTKKLGKKRKDAKWKKTKGVGKKLPIKIHDMLSAIYYNRSSSRQGKVGDIFFIDIFDDNKLTKLTMKILKEETIKVRINSKLEKIKTFMVEPKITTSGIFKIKGDIFIWISADKRRWPVRIKADAPVIGHIYIQLYRTIKTTP